MRMQIARPGRPFAGMAMKMEMDGAIDMAMLVEMGPVMPHPPKDVTPQSHQHDADRGLEEIGQVFGDCSVKQERSPGEEKERDGMTQPPGQTTPDDLADGCMARCNTGHSSNMISLKRMLHAEQEAKT